MKWGLAAAAGLNRGLRRDPPELSSQSCGTLLLVLADSTSPRPATACRKRPRTAVSRARRRLCEGRVDGRQGRPRAASASSAPVSLAHRVGPPASLLLVRDGWSCRDVCESERSAGRVLLVQCHLRGIETDGAAELGTVARARAELERAHAAASVPSAGRLEHLWERARRGQRRRLRESRHAALRARDRPQSLAGEGGGGRLEFGVAGGLRAGGEEFFREDVGEAEVDCRALRGGSATEEEGGGRGGEAGRRVELRRRHERERGAGRRCRDEGR